MCKDSTHNMGKTVPKINCAVCTPSIRRRSRCTHGYDLQSISAQCNPGITDRNNLTTRHKKEREIFFSHTAAEPIALEEKEQCKLTSDYKDLQGRAEIEYGKEGKRSALRSKKEQVQSLCCSQPEAHNKTMAYLKPYEARIFSEGRPNTFAIKQWLRLQWRCKKYNHGGAFGCGQIQAQRPIHIHRWRAPEVHRRG
jgi:hypothetical protein